MGAIRGVAAVFPSSQPVSSRRTRRSVTAGMPPKWFARTDLELVCGTTARLILSIVSYDRVLQLPGFDGAFAVGLILASSDIASSRKRRICRCARSWRTRGVSRGLRRILRGSRNRRLLFCPLLGHPCDWLKIGMDGIGDKACARKYRRLGTHRDGLRLVALKRKRRREFGYLQLEFTWGATGLP